MYNSIRILVTITFLGLAKMKGQVPSTFSFQGLALHTDGHPMKDVDLTVSIEILSGLLSDDPSYREVHKVTTTKKGHYNLLVGGGDIELGSFDNLSWSEGDHFARISTAIDGNDFRVEGTIQFMAVPLALAADFSESGLQGPKGPKGIDGSDGSPGLKGPTGPQGENGMNLGGTTTQGQQGAPGMQGPQGPQGPSGMDGSDVGPKGPAGPQGDPGPSYNGNPIQGLRGMQGPQGPIGPQGDQGPQGLKGPRGITGSMGAKGKGGGPQGDPGPPGPTGKEIILPGSQGYPGINGLDCYDTNGNGVFLGLSRLQGP